MLSTPDCWIRVDVVRRLRGGLELALAVHRGKRGPRVGTWRVHCSGLRETHIADLNGGGMRLYTSSHPAARQYAAAGAQLRVTDIDDVQRVLGALLRAHVATVDDWIPFDRYFKENGGAQRPRKLVLRGPEFLMRAYARALRALPVSVRVSVKAQPKRLVRPQVLHFGGSYIVADGFAVQEG